MATLVIVLVLACIVGAVVAAFGGFAPARVIRRTTVVERPVERGRVVEEHRYIEE